MITLRNKLTNEVIGSISAVQLQYLIDQLEEEHRGDKDYWLHRTQVDIFREQGADPGLLATLEAALGSGDEVEITWSSD